MKVYVVHGVMDWFGDADRCVFGVFSKEQDAFDKETDLWAKGTWQGFPIISIQQTEVELDKIIT